jgi:hypothetical protein
MNKDTFEVRVSVEVNGKPYSHAHKFSGTPQSLANRKKLVEEAVATLIHKMEQEGAFSKVTK